MFGHLISRGLGFLTVSGAAADAKHPAVVQALKHACSSHHLCRKKPSCGYMSRNPGSVRAAQQGHSRVNITIKHCSRYLMFPSLQRPISAEAIIRNQNWTVHRHTIQQTARRWRDLVVLDERHITSHHLFLNVVPLQLSTCI
ncbi:hypothetical protein HDV57DRAFT_485177 [Trichoderma longibrachiatum]